jgi:hypothetical protein
VKRESVKGEGKLGTLMSHYTTFGTIAPQAADFCIPDCNLYSQFTDNLWRNYGDGVERKWELPAPPECPVFLRFWNLTNWVKWSITNA